MSREVALEVQEWTDGVVYHNLDGTCNVIVEGERGNNIDFFIKDGFIYMGKDPVTMDIVRMVGNYITSMDKEWV